MLGSEEDIDAQVREQDQRSLCTYSQPLCTIIMDYQPFHAKINYKQYSHDFGTLDKNFDFVYVGDL